MTKIPFTLEAWLKDKSQKVETRNGRPVHYIGLDRAGWQVFEIFRTNGTSEYRTYHDSYMYCGPEESTYDLFIVTPEPELTEWEKTVKDRLWRTLEYSETFRKDEYKWVQELAAELLAIARKELENEAPSIIHAQSFNAGLKHGKEEALKNLPRWKRSKPESGRNYVLMFKGGSVLNTTDFRKDGKFYYEDGESYNDIHYNDSCVMWMYLDELLQLPGFKENESHE